MSDEQWLWLFINQRIDADEKLEKMCSKCREEVTSSDHKCIRCGKDIIEGESFINPNFDMDRYNELSGHVEDLYLDDDEDDMPYSMDDSDQYNEDEDDILHSIDDSDNQYEESYRE